MITLKLEFTKKKFCHKQIKREGDLAIYERWHEDSESQHHYEVIIIVEGKEFEKADIKFPAAELYPVATQWGSRGWSFKKLVDAEVKFNKLKNMKTENNANPNETVVAEPKRRGRPRRPFSWPTGPFQVKSLAENLGCSIPMIYQRIKEAGPAIKLVGTESHGSGKPANIYEYKGVSEAVKADFEQTLENILAKDDETLVELIEQSTISSPIGSGAGDNEPLYPESEEETEEEVIPEPELVEAGLPEAFA